MISRRSSRETPEVMKFRIRPRSQTIAIAPELAPVSERAPAMASRSTLATSRLWLMRRIAALSRDARSAEGPLRSGSLIVPLPPRGETSGGGSAGLPGTEKIASFGKKKEVPVTIMTCEFFALSRYWSLKPRRLESSSR